MGAPLATGSQGVVFLCACDWKLPHVTLPLLPAVSAMTSAPRVSLPTRTDQLPAILFLSPSTGDRTWYLVDFDRCLLSEYMKAAPQTRFGYLGLCQIQTV